MKNSFLTLTCLFFFIASNAQSGYADQLSADNNMLSMKPKGRTNVNIEGTPYIIEKFQPITLTGQGEKNFQGRYNAYNGDMEVLDVKKGVVFVLNKNMTNYDVNFKTQRKTYKSFEHKTEDGKVAHGFFVKLSDNNGVSLLKKENVKFFKEVKAVSTYDKARTAKYRRANDQYFIKINEDAAIELSTKKKDIAKLFPNKSKDILGYIKSNKLNTKDEADLIKLINHISSL